MTAPCPLRFGFALSSRSSAWSWIPSISLSRPVFSTALTLILVPVLYVFFAEHLRMRVV